MSAKVSKASRGFKNFPHDKKKGFMCCRTEAVDLQKLWLPTEKMHIWSSLHCIELKASCESYRLASWIFTKVAI